MIDMGEELETYKSVPETNARIRKYFNRKNNLSFVCLESRAKEKAHYQTLKKYQEFIELTDSLNLNPDAIFTSIVDKLYLLKDIMGYKELKGGGKIENCFDEQIGKAFKNTYYNTLEAIQRGEAKDSLLR